MSQPENTKPVGEIIMWPVKAAVWQNGAYFSVTFQRVYNSGGEYASSYSYDRDHLLLLAKVADHAHTWILRAEQKARQETEGK